MREIEKDNLSDDQLETANDSASGRLNAKSNESLFYKKARVHANISFKITPHVLRASTVTYLKQQEFSDSDIMRVTGHASAEMVYAYDKSSKADNASKKVQLVS